MPLHFLGLPHSALQQIYGIELIAHGILMGLFYARRNSVGLLFLQMLPRVLRHEGADNPSGMPPEEQCSDKNRLTTRDKELCC